MTQASPGKHGIVSSVIFVQSESAEQDDRANQSSDYLSAAPSISHSGPLHRECVADKGAND